MKKAIMMLALLVIPFALQAQTKFHDVEANEATGKVKKLTVNVMGQSQTINFTPEGKMQMDNLSDAVYDADGYLQSAKISAQGMSTTVKYTWENGKMVGQSVSVMGQEMKTSRTYNEKGAPATETINMGGQSINSTYSDYQYDDHGNWISRKANMMGQNMDQTRTIEYYE